MGHFPYFPNFYWNFKSHCCNAGEKDEKESVKSTDGENLEESRRPSWLWRSSETSQKNKGDGEEDGKMVEQSTGIQSKQTDEEKISN